MKTYWSIVAGLMLGFPAALCAQDAPTNPAIRDRMDLMETVRANTRTLRDMAQGKITFDRQTAETARSALAAAAAEMPARFQAPETDPRSEALPAIWDDFPGFMAIAEDLVTAAEAINLSGLNGLRAGIDPVAQTCKSCHDRFRRPE